MTGSSRSLGNRVPSYLLHKPSGRARVRINGKDYYLGVFGSEESKREYGELIAKHAAGMPLDSLDSPPSALAGITINELCLAFLLHAEKHYLKNGRTTDEVRCFKCAIKPLVELYGSTSAEDFKPSALKAVREKMIEADWSRKFINKSCSRIRLIFRYGIENDLINDPNVLLRLKALSPLLRGRTDAKDPPARSVVPQESIDAVKKVVPQRTADLIDFQLLTGARPGELMMLTGAMIDQSREIWVAELSDHKNSHHGKHRFLVFGPRAQAILRRYLVEDPDQPLFTFTRKWYGMAVGFACEKVGVPRFTPHWLRHNAASNLREQFGLDAAQLILGHSSANVTEVYAHLNIKRAVEVARDVG